MARAKAGDSRGVTGEAGVDGTLLATVAMWASPGLQVYVSGLLGTQPCPEPRPELWCQPMRHDDVTTRVLKEDGGRAVRVLRAPGALPQTIKSWVMTPWFVCKCFMGIAQPWRHLRGSRRLRRAQVQTPPVTSMRLGWRRHRPVFLLAMPFVEGETALDRLRNCHPIDADGLASQLGLIVAKLASAGLRHRDFKLSNVVVERDTEDLWLIDPVGVVRGRDQAAALTTMLERLDVEVREGHAGHVFRAPLLRRIMVRAALQRLPRSLRKEVLLRLREHPGR